jgi:two-component system, NarL family, sensor kinase
MTIKELRSLLVEIYPPDLHRTGLEAALADLTAAFESRGLKGSLDLPAEVSLPAEPEALIFRVAQEALRNTASHAHANNVAVRLRIADHEAIISVSDDGRGFVPEAVTGSHFGLRMLGDLARDAGGRLELISAPGACTTIRLAVPL